VRGSPHLYMGLVVGHGRKARRSDRRSHPSLIIALPGVQRLGHYLRLPGLVVGSGRALGVEIHDSRVSLLHLVRRLKGGIEAGRVTVLGLVLSTHITLFRILEILGLETMLI
jgi:hypothetical protein